ncbi:GNAT family N-acetyltransferase [Actinacidiphila acididurans]|uniref:GNAT family N-acetyltransferase n=1 Tax=Actinacidiphila acididurans TaxID=2784346 RepID=A0ABS2U1K3_9ACTN|nr:GNAT family N-acetyltransferase [Actinacidiphila acididurans]MBM9509489.1 GNAT family N-acetyltransferase [Actinacidiphila acididurans]
MTSTPRLILTRPHPDDADWVFAIHGDPATNRHNPHGPHTSLQESAGFLASVLADWDRDGIGYCAVSACQDPATVIGFAGTRLIDLAGDRVLNLYYRFTPSTWGQGIAQEAARTALDHARARFPGTPVVALIREDNQPSKRLAERLGLHPAHSRT